MIDYTANLVGVLGLAVADRLQETARNVLNHSGETPAAVVVIGYGLGPSNDELRKTLGLSHPGTVRLVDRLVAHGLVERRTGDDKRKVALFLTNAGYSMRKTLLKERIAAIKPLLAPLSDLEQETLADLLHKVLSRMDTTDQQRQTLCRLCDDQVCINCPIPATFRNR